MPDRPQPGLDSSMALSKASINVVTKGNGFTMNIRSSILSSQVTIGGQDRESLLSWLSKIKALAKVAGQAVER